MFRARDYDRTEKDDLALNILPLLDKSNEAIPVYDSKTKQIMGWKIQNRFE